MTTKFLSIAIVFVIIAQFMNAVNDFSNSEKLNNLENRVSRMEAQLGELN